MKSTDLFTRTVPTSVSGPRLSADPGLPVPWSSCGLPQGSTVLRHLRRNTLGAQTARRCWPSGRGAGCWAVPWGPAERGQHWERAQAEAGGVVDGEPRQCQSPRREHVAERSWGQFPGCLRFTSGGLNAIKEGGFDLYSFSVLL